MPPYRYALEPYRGPQTRYVCPKCQKPRQFTRYIDLQGGVPVSEVVGRCNREVQCGYHYTPRQYYAARPLARPCSKPTPPQAALPPAPATPDYIAPSLVQQSLQHYAQNHLVTYLRELFSADQVTTLLDRFHVGTSKRWPGASIFWQVDTQGRVRTGKIMLYDPQSGRRVKQPYNHIDWVHKKLGKPRFHLRQCLFGLDQLSKAPLDQAIGLVESEKTALIAQGYCPSLLWLATGSLHQLHLVRQAPLSGRALYLFPDTGAHACWSKQAPVLSKALGSRVEVSSWLEGQLPGQEGLDLADVLR